MNTAAPQYDPGLVPSEVAARQEREGKRFGKTAKMPMRENLEGLNATGGYTLDQEGLGNIHAIEPEMYVNQPGDLRQAEANRAAKRAAELAALSTDQAGRLTMTEDTRPKGPGLV